MGNCGVGFAPCRTDADSRDFLLSLVEAVEDIPNEAMSVGIDWAGQHSFGPRSTVPRWVNYKTELSRWLPTLQPLSEVLGYPAK